MKLRFLFLLLIFSSAVVAGNQHKSSSVLATGKWWKLSVQKTGIYKISYEDLNSMKMDPESLDPQGIRLFGNGSGMLSETNKDARYDDLREIPLQVMSASEHSFQPGDYLLFYGESPDAWKFDNATGLFLHKKNLASDSSFYFLTYGTTPGKRVIPVASLDSTPNYYSQRFIDYSFHELDSLNLIKSGKLWVGEVFDYKRNSYDFNYSFPNIDTSSVFRVVTSVVARAPLTSKFLLSINGQLRDSVQVELTDPQSLNIFATGKKKTSNIIHAPSDGKITFLYRLPTSSSTGWLDYLELVCQRYLIFSGPQMTFRDPNSVGQNKVTEFYLRGTDTGMHIWDITSIDDIHQILPVTSDSSMKFRVVTDTLKEFIAFDSAGYYPVNVIGEIGNQDLHGLNPSTLVIITHPEFLSQAERLATFHREYNGISVQVVNVNDIYNEFSCGQNDLTAIRDFMKMLYDRGYPGNQPSYLLLFGDGTYDPKNRLPGNNNFIPTYQSTESLRPLGTFVTDDYYGIMADNAGAEASGNIDIGIGRFPVSTLEQATTTVDKIIHYASKTDSVLSDWRNTITFIADDENNNLHFHQAEQLAQIVKDKYPVYNVSKIYLDAYKMVGTPAGDRLPDVNTAIAKAVSKGTLILNYTGHGGEDGWSAEKVLTVADINNWENKDKLPVFITATCEFSRFDNPERLTGGEMVFLNPHGGAIALYSTTRLALATSNFKLDTSFFGHLFSDNGDPNPKLGDLIRLSKNNNGNNGNVKNFVLLGDPAQDIAFPAYKVKTSEINHTAVGIQPDTALGMSNVTVKGEIVDRAGNRMNTFSGTLFPTVFDKPVIFRTLGNTSGSYPENFALQNSVLFRGRSTVTNGEFEFHFTVPREVALQLGNGKISYYAQNGASDANGYFDNLVIGGEDPTVDPQNSGPQIHLYMDTTTFISGQRTGTNPLLIAFLEDSDGINAYSLGIGHDITATLDHDNSHQLLLNDFFQPTFDKCGSGIIRYPFSSLSTGHHTLTMKAWDLYNNSSTQEMEFFVFDQPSLSVMNLTAIPNPVVDHTVFSFKPTQPFGTLSVRIEIFTYSGQIVRTLEDKFIENTTSAVVIPWDGTGENNQTLPDGLYIYRLVASGSNGASTTTSQKLIISH
jgi:hypothetical protein